MLADDASFGTKWGGAYPDVFAVEVEVWKINPSYWSHKKGGNYVRHDGSGSYKGNFRRYSYPTSADGYPNYCKGWPCTYHWAFPSWTMLNNEISK